MQAVLIGIIAWIWMLGAFLVIGITLRERMLVEKYKLDTSWTFYCTLFLFWPFMTTAALFIGKK